MAGAFALLVALAAVSALGSRQKASPALLHTHGEIRREGDIHNKTASTPQRALLSRRQDKVRKKGVDPDYYLIQYISSKFCSSKKTVCQPIWADGNCHQFTVTAGSSPSYTLYSTCSKSGSSVTCSATNQDNAGCNCPANEQTFAEGECNMGDASTKLVSATDGEVSTCVSTAADTLGGRHCLRYFFHSVNRTVLNASEVPELKENKTAPHSAAHRSAAAGLLALFAVFSWQIAA
eukprot:gnl/TRDRNA2_/TRDRNA2_85860_c0_seq1.p1 gnl/TRDRNA2_/TRDRNA2_85860_c0~~gnl/TRDRNA2_/TRDRNA2_85860_c0_seq1.p1  ORF type:complete len:235 (-),score=36.09 gnl/TRDRNA2_/TRDRNA2_85860_c0_seq1:232-936(-)